MTSDGPDPTRVFFTFYSSSANGRDVKPENIVLEGGRAGGRIYLVDFGGVQAAAAAEGARGQGSVGTTIIGTYGYMAPEQFRGASEPASDLYGLGGTLLFLLSGIPPSGFPQRGLHLDYGEGLVRDPELAAVLSGLLEPLTENRMGSREALGLLDGKLKADRRGAVTVQRPRSEGLGPSQQPAGGRTVLLREGLSLLVDIPPAGFTGESVYSGAFAVAWNVFVGLWTFGAVTGGGILFALFSLPFWAAGFMLGKTAVAQSLIREKLQISAGEWQLNQQLAFLKEGGAQWGTSGRKSLSGSTADLGWARVVTGSVVNGVPQTHIELEEGVRKHMLGEALSTIEQQWLAAQINEHIQSYSAAKVVQDRMGAVRKLFVEPSPMPDSQPGPDDAGWGWDSSGFIAEDDMLFDALNFGESDRDMRSMDADDDDSG